MVTPYTTQTFYTPLHEGYEGTPSYSSSDPDVATIDSSSGEVTAHKVGDAIIIATIPEVGDYLETTKSYILYVEQADNPAYADPFEVNLAVGGNKINLSQNVKDVPEGSTVTYSIVSPDPKGCGVIADTGVFTSGNDTTDVGNPIIVQVSIGETTNYKPTTLNIAVSIVRKEEKNLENFSQKSITYGEVLESPTYDQPPESGVESIEYEGILRDGAAYGPTSEKPTEAGSYNVKVLYETSDTIYSGQADFVISPRNISDAAVTLLGHLTYNGQTQTQVVQSVIVLGENIIELCDINGNTALNAGDYSLTATISEDIGNYTGSVTKQFTVDRAPSQIGNVYADNLKDTLDPSLVVFHRQDETIPGTFSIVEDKLMYGTHTYHWVFTPDDITNYEPVRGTVQITVTKTKSDPVSDSEPAPESGTVKNQDKSTQFVKTGDSSNLSFLVALFGASSVGYCSSLLSGKKRKKK